jgi:hypothetical protein
MHQDELPDRRGHPRADISQAQNADTEPDRDDDAVAVGDLAGQYAAGTESEHHERKGQRSGAAARAELGLDHGKCDHHRPHADAAERADQHGHGKAGPCPTRIGNEQLGISGEFRRNCHGGGNFGCKSPKVKPQWRDIGHAIAGEHLRTYQRIAPQSRGAMHPRRARPRTEDKYLPVN